ncbi:MAG: T9SS type A sorting domain-containing protein [Bacteroidia bacterium]
MKKISTLLLLAFASMSFAQSFKITYGGKDVSGTEFTKYISAGDYNIIDFGLENKSNVDKLFKVARTVKSPAKLEDCSSITIWTSVLSYMTNHESIDTLPDSFPFEANSTLPKDSVSPGLLVNLNVCPVCVDHTIVYRIWDESNDKDFAEVTINYTCTNGIKEHDLGTISPAYPNPANGMIAIDYTLKNTPKNAKIIFYDRLGKMVKETPIANQQGTAKINISELCTGFYFYNFVVDGKTSNARKLIISGN